MRVEFCAVDFAYEAERQILHKLDFSIQPGQTVAVVGHSGAGKSTIGKIIAEKINKPFVDIDNKTPPLNYCL